MDAVTQIMDQLGPDGIAQISKMLGASQKKTDSALSAALPVLVSGLASNATKPGGAASIYDAVAKDHDGAILDDVSGFLGNPSSVDGAGIVGHVLGVKQPTVEAGLAKKTGLTMEQITKLLAIAAPLVMAFLGKKQRKGKFDVTDLTDLLGDQLSAGKNNQGLLDILGTVLDADKDGSPVDELMDVLGGALKKRKS